MSIKALIHRHPMRAAAAAMLDAERALDEMQRQRMPYHSLRFVGQRHFAPRVDAVENENEYVISAELPGVEPAHLEVFVEDGVLTIKGERKAAGDTDESEGSSPFRRRIRFNGEIDGDGVKARYKHGLLSVSVPKARPPEPEIRTIPISVD